MQNELSNFLHEIEPCSTADVSNSMVLEEISELNAKTNEIQDEKEPSETIRSYETRGDKDLSELKYSSALVNYQSALDMIVKFPLNQTRSCIRLYDKIGKTSLLLSYYDVALDYQNKCLASRIQHNGPNHLDNALTPPPKI